MERLFEIENLRCSYDRHYREGVSRVVLDIRHLSIPRGLKVFIVGESGIGKSTILELLGLMNDTIVPDPAARFLFYGADGKETDLIGLWRRNSDRELSEFRRNHFNFIFQSTNLMRNFTAYENVAITRMLQGYSQEEAFGKASEALSELGLGQVGSDRMVWELSGGQQQRLAFARAVLPDFTVLFGDEPTGNLDGANAVRAMELLSAKLSELEGSSAIIVTHDMNLAVSFADLIVYIRKASDAQAGPDGEPSFRGVIDDGSMFTPREFELYLAHKQ